MRYGQLTAILAVTAALAFVPNLQDATGFPVFYLVYAYFVFFWIAQSTSWNILSGYSGYFSFGQGAFYGLGVYAAADLMSREGVDYFVTIPIAGVLGALLALVPLAHLLPSVVRLDVVERRVEPVAARATRVLRGEDLDEIAVLELVVERHDLIVDARPAARSQHRHRAAR